MKLYCIPKGTKGIVLTETKIQTGLGSNGSGYTARLDDGVPYTTTKDLEYTETVTDPIRVQSRPDATHAKLSALAEIGYAFFERSSEKHTWYLGVKYNEIEVL